MASQASVAVADALTRYRESLDDFSDPKGIDPDKFYPKPNRTIIRKYRFGNPLQADGSRAGRSRVKGPRAVLQVLNWLGDTTGIVVRPVGRQLRKPRTGGVR